MELWGFPICFAVLVNILISPHSCAPIDDSQLRGYISGQYPQKNYDVLSSLPYMDKSDQIEAVEKSGDNFYQGKRLPPLPWKRLPTLPWDKRNALPPLPWKKRIQLDDDIDSEEYLRELMKLLNEWESEPEKRLPPLPWNKRLPPLPWNKRLPALPWNKRLPPLPWNKRLPPLPLNKRNDLGNHDLNYEKLVTKLYKVLQEIKNREASNEMSSTL